MPNIKLKDGSGIEQTYTGIDTITVPLADGTGNWTFGLTDEELTLTGNTSYICQGDSPLGSEYYINRITFNNITNASGLFYKNNNITDLSNKTINLTSTDRVMLSSMFEGCQNLIVLPTINLNNQKLYCNQSSNIISRCYKLPASEIYKLYNLISSNNNTDSFQSAPIGHNYSVDELDLRNYNWFMSGSSYSYDRNLGYLSNHATLKVLKLPTWSNNSGAITSSSYWAGSSSFLGSGNYSMPWITTIVFNTNQDSSPIEIRVKNQTLRFDVIGHYPYTNTPNYWDDIKQYSTLGFSDNDLLRYDSSSHDYAWYKARYDVIKTRPNWVPCSSDTISFNGVNKNAALLFSRFNHTSMVNLINSLPDTSAYLATAGGTNTIKFAAYQGDATDEGGSSNLTAEEIAVATNKGWTVTIV